jgi:hypothetical protein
MTFITADCTCKPDQLYADGSKPAFYSDEKKAQWMYEKLKKSALYWGVHLNGLHIMTIRP